MSDHLFENPITVPYSNLTNGLFDDSEPSVKNQGTLQTIFWYYILLVSIFGIVLNSYCVSTLIKFVKRFRLRHVPQTLYTIAASDISALTLILIGHLRLNSYIENYYLLEMFCKLHTLLLQSLSAYSTWCWVLLSLIRYMAVFHPYKHMLIDLVSLKYSLSFTLLCCFGIEGWTLVLVQHKEYICTMNLTLISQENMQYLIIADILLTYAAPLICIIVLNAAVFAKLHFYRTTNGIEQIRADSLVPSELPNGYSSAAVLSVHRVKRLRKQKLYFLIRLIVLVSINLILNLPNNIIRVLNAFDAYGRLLPYPYNQIVQRLSYALSYTHYGINCVYTRFILNGRVSRKRSFKSDDFSTAGTTRMNESTC